MSCLNFRQSNLWLWNKRKRRLTRKKSGSVTKHYSDHKELARELVLARLAHFNQHYHFSWKRVAIRNQRRCWGSCSSLKNLNFNYKILFLPSHLQDYIIVHEMCHLQELNHKAGFWNLVSEMIPNHRHSVAELKLIDKAGHSIKNLQAFQAHYLSGAKVPVKPLSDAATRPPLWCGSCGRNAVCSCSFDKDSL